MIARREDKRVPICDLTKRAKAKRLEANLCRLFIGYKKFAGKSWDDLAEACDEERRTLQKRFENGLLTMWEWKILLKEVAMPTEEFLEVMKL